VRHVHRSHLLEYAWLVACERDRTTPPEPLVVTGDDALGSGGGAPQFSSRTPDDEAHAGVIEVDRATNEPAWHLRVYGEGCDASHAKGLDANHSASCANNIWNGWKMCVLARSRPVVGF
jgi:hypothetical protein